MAESGVYKIRKVVMDHFPYAKENYVHFVFGGPSPSGNWRGLITINDCKMIITELGEDVFTMKSYYEDEGYSYDTTECRYTNFEQAINGILLELYNRIYSSEVLYG